jgi:drug/metabolite transporter (DMT)-like permease
MHEYLGVLAAVLSSALGGIAGGTTRFVIGATDPVTLGVFRFGTGFLILLPIAIASGRRWPEGRDWVAAALLGILFFFAFSILFNLAYTWTTAARGALALSTMPLMTMLVAAAVGEERLSLRKSVGVVIAMGGVALALASGVRNAPPDAWRGEAVMLAGTFCMSLYNVWARPFMARADPLTFLTAGMGAATACLLVWAIAIGGFSAVRDFNTAHWIAVGYLGVLGSAVIFFLWVYALSHTTPTKAAVSITVNPVFAALVGALVIGEPIGIDLAIGLVAVLAGIAVAATDRPLVRAPSRG